MFGFCWHKWHIINQYADDTIRSTARDPKYDPDLDDYIGGLPKPYKEKICLKCERYVDEITPRYEYHLAKFLERRDIAKEMLSRLERSKKAWERTPYKEDSGDRKEKRYGKSGL